MINIEMPVVGQLTKRQKDCVLELDVYFKMKEAECDRLLNKNYEEVRMLQKKLPAMGKAVSVVSLYYRNYRLCHKTLPEEFPHRFRRAEGLRQYLEPVIKEGHHFIDDLPVGYSLYKFWVRYCHGDINILIDFVQDIPGRLENILVIEQEVRLSTTGRRII